MQTLQTLVVTLVVALILAACSGVETRPEETDTFAAGNYKFYRWRSEPLENTASSRDPVYIMDPIVRAAVDAELKNKGYRLNPEKAQFNVDYLFATGMRMGQKGSEASNLSNYPGVIPNRNVDQASVDNAYALGGVKETSNIALQFNDVERKEEVWRVIVTKIVEDANRVDSDRLRKNINSAVKEGLRPLPKAN